MKEAMIKTGVLIIMMLADLPRGDAAVLEAMIQIDSNNFEIAPFLQRFKKFIERSHSDSSLQHSENPWIHRFVNHNDTFQANYDFSRNILTMASSYSLMLNGTETKISDVKITINFRFDQESNEKIILEDMHGENAIPRIGHESRHYDTEWYDFEGETPRIKPIKPSTLGKFLTPIVDVVEPIIVAFIHIVINGVLGHVLSTAFDHLCNGRLISR